jgi:hypothetical protein
MFQTKVVGKIKSVEPDRPQITGRMSFACLTTKARDTHSENVIIIAIPRQERLQERASILRLYVHRLSCFVNNESVKG